MRKNINLVMAWQAVWGGGTLLLILLVGGYILHKYQWAESQLAQLEPRYARLQGLGGAVEELAKANAQAQQRLAQHVYPAEQDAGQVGAAVQQRVRELFTAAGLQIVSSQVMPAKVEKSFDLVPLSVRAEGDLIALQGGLVALSGQRPTILVKGVNVQILGAMRSDAPQRLAVQFDLQVLRGHTP